MEFAVASFDDDQSVIHDTRNLRVSCSVYRYSCISIHENI